MHPLTDWTQDPPVKTTAVSNSEWKLVGEFELAFSPGAAGVVSALVEGLLQPLALSVDLRTRILNSAQDAIVHITPTDSPVREVGHVHLLILVIPDRRSKGKTWGFFRIEKMDGPGNDHNPYQHSIEFYIYHDV